MRNEMNANNNEGEYIKVVQEENLGFYEVVYVFTTWKHTLLLNEFA